MECLETFSCQFLVSRVHHITSNELISIMELERLLDINCWTNYFSH